MPDDFYPYAGVRRTADDPTTADAARILRAHFGFADSTDSDSTFLGDPSGALTLARNRGSEMSELADRIPNEEAASLIPMEGFVPGEPGRRFTSRLPQANLITDKARLAALQGEEHADPETGDAAQARTTQVQDALDAAATTQRTEVGNAARTTAQRNAFAEYMKEYGLKLGDYTAAASPAAQAAAMVPINTQLSDNAQALKDSDLDRKGREKMQPQILPGQIPDGKGGFRDAPVKSAPNATEETQLRSIDNTFGVVRDLKALLDPSNNQITDSLTNHALFPLYKAGIDPTLFGADPKTRRRFQLASLVQVLGTTPYANQTRNYNFIQDIRAHLTDPKATDQFLYGQIEELERRLPEFRDTIERVHKYPWQRPEGMAGGDGSGDGSGSAINATITSDPGASAAPAAAAPTLHPKYAPPTVEELGVDDVINSAETFLKRPRR